MQCQPNIFNKGIHAYKKKRKYYLSEGVGTSQSVLRLVKLRAQSSRNLPKTSNPKYQELGRQKTSDKTLVTLTPTAHFREFPKITLRFDNLQAEFTELMVAVVLMAIFIIGKGKKNQNQAKGRDAKGQIWKRVQVCNFRSSLPKEPWTVFPPPSPRA